MIPGGVLGHLRAVRLREVTWEQYQVRQHPMNQYPEGHPQWLPPLPAPPDIWETEKMRWVCSEELQPLWDAGAPCRVVAGLTPPVGALGLYRPQVGVLWPVRLAREHGAAWYVERLADPPSPPSRLDPTVLRYEHPAWYRAEHWDLRVFTGASTDE